MSKDLDSPSARAASRAFLALAKDLAGYAGWRGVFAILYIALGAIFESFGLLLVVPLLVLVINGGNGHGRAETIMSQAFAFAGATTPTARLVLLMAGFAAIMIARAIVLTLRDTSINQIQTGFTEHFRQRIALALANAGWDQVLRLRHARVLSVMSNDIQRVSGATRFLMQGGIAAVILLAQTVLAFVLSPVLALIAIGMLVIGAIAMIPVLTRNRALGRFVSQTNASLMETTTQFMSGLKFAISQDLQASFVDEFGRTNTALADRQIRFFRLQIMVRTALTTLSALVGIGVFYLGYRYVGLPAPVLIAFLLVVGRMSGPANQIQQGFQQLALGLPSHEAILELVADLRTRSPALVAAPSPPPTGAIVLNDVSFQHVTSDDGAAQGVRSVRLTIEPGAILGISGPSGAGKTTLADLLVGLLSPQAGRITIGGAQLDARILSAWRAQLAYISQDPFLFHDTIRRNLLWANPGATEAAMWAALEMAGADGIVRRMDGSLDAIVGERGTLISGGERQRIAMARALLRKPKFLVMDEATNAIDVAGERQLMERLLAGPGRMTIVVIAHRAETLALCDRVVRVEDGRLQEDG